MTPLEWMTDPHLCGKTFGGPTFVAARALVAAIFGLPMTEEMLAIFQACTARETARATAYSRAIVLAGRGSGKTLLAVFVMLYVAASRDFRTIMGPGELVTVMFVTPDRRQSRVAMRYLRGLLLQSPMLSRLIESETKESITLTTGAVLEVATSSYRSTRGYSLAGVVIDEAAFLPTDDSANPDTELWRAVQPGLARVPGSLALAVSSPFAKRGLVYDAWKRDFGVADAPTLVWQAPTRTMNPTIKQAVIDEALADDEVAARSEWLAAWRDDVASFISLEALEAVTVPGRIELPPTADRPAFAFCDPAGGTGKDSFAMAIGHRDADRVVVDRLVEVLPPFDPDQATREMAAVLHAYRVTTVVGDKYAGAWPTSRFAAHGIHYRESDQVRSDLYRNALPLITAQRCEFPDSKKLQRQFLSLDRSVSKSGRETIDASRGRAHDDLCNVVAGLLCIAAAPRMRAGTLRVIGW